MVHGLMKKGHNGSKEVNMEFYFNIKDYYHEQLANPTTPYGSISEATIEAKKYLVTRNTSDGYSIEIYEQSPEERIGMAARGELPIIPTYSEFITQGEIEAFAQSLVPKYPDYIMQKVRQRLDLEPWDTSRDGEINNMTHDVVFGHCLVWEGIIGYEYPIMAWVEGIFGVTLT